MAWGRGHVKHKNITIHPSSVSYRAVDGGDGGGGDSGGGTDGGATAIPSGGCGYGGGTATAGDGGGPDGTQAGTAGTAADGPDHRCWRLTPIQHYNSSIIVFPRIFRLPSNLTCATLPSSNGAAPATQVRSGGARRELCSRGPVVH